MTDILPSKGEKEVRIADLVLCHDEPELLKRLARALAYKDDKLFVHVDKKSDINPFIEAVQGLRNVVFLQQRESVYWGGFNSITATMALVRAALRDNIKYDRMVLLQGKDYPLRSPEYIHDFFKKRKEEEFCKAKNITKSKDPRDYMKCCGWWNLDRKPNLWQKSVNRFFSFLNTKLRVKYRKGYFSLGGRYEKWDIYKGWAQVAVTRECAVYILKIYEEMPKYNRYMRHRFPPDELYIHTIIYNSSFRKQITDYSLVPRKNAEWFSEQLNVTYFEYPKNVTIFKQAADYKELLETNGLFFRKATYAESSELLDEIDRFIKQGKNYEK